MLPNSFTTAALVASLLIGTSTLALAQTQENKAAAPATGPATNSAPAAPVATQAEPKRAEPQRATQAEPQKPGQAEPQRATQAEPQKPGQAEPQKATQAEPQRAVPDQAGATKSSEAAGRGSSSAGATVNLTTTQKTEIHNTIINNSSAPRATNIGISLAVGVAVPTAVQFAPLPANVVVMEPAWRGYEYFLYGEQIVIIEPETRRIVAIVVA